MSFFTNLLGREKKVTNQKLADDISKLCEELTSGIIELSNKANKINELKEKYKQSESELEESSTDSENQLNKPVKEKSFLSSIFGLSEPEAPAETSDTKQPQQDINSSAKSDYVDPESLSAQSVQSVASTEQIPPSSPPSENQIDKPFPSDFSQSSDMFSSSPPSLDINNPAPEASTVPQSPPPPPPPDTSALSLDSLQSPPDQQVLQKSQEQPNKGDDFGKNDILPNVGGKNRKKSKRSKQTIRKANKNSNRVTKKQKNTTTTSTTTTTDSKARAQGLAQALLQAQGQS